MNYIEYNSLNISKLVEVLTTELINNYSQEEIVKKAYDFREKNWTSYGTYVRLQHSVFSDSFQDELREKIGEKTDDLIQDLYPNYNDLQIDEFLSYDDVKEDLEGIEEGSDEYYEIIESYIYDDQCINNPILHFELAFMEMIEEYVETLEEKEEELQEELTEMVEGLGLVDDGNFIYDENNDYEEEAIEYEWNLDYETLQYNLVIFDYEGEDFKNVTIEELKNILKNFKNFLVV